MQTRKYERVDNNNIDDECTKSVKRQNHTLQYVNTTLHSKITNINISIEPRVGVIIHLDFNNVNEQLMIEAKRNFISSLPIIFKVKYPSISDSTIFPFMVLRIDFKARIDLFEFLKAIDICDQLDHQTVSEISQFLAIPTLLNDDKLINMIENGCFEEVFSEAVNRQKNDPHILYRLAKLCETYCVDHPQRLVDCYQSITEDSPYYQEANHELLHIAINDHDEMVKTEAERISNLERLFYFALNGGDKDSRLASQFYHKLCGYNDMNPTLQDIKGDYNTLIKIAAMIRELKQANEKSNLIHNSGTQTFFGNDNNSLHISTPQVFTTPAEVKANIKR